MEVDDGPGVSVAGKRNNARSLCDPNRFSQSRATSNHEQTEDARIPPAPPLEAAWGISEELINRNSPGMQSLGGSERRRKRCFVGSLDGRRRR